MRKVKKTLLTVACAGALVVGSVAATVAYLTSEDSVLNTFTVGDVTITLDEADMSTVDPNDRTDTGNAYHLLPGQSYKKDPIVTVLNGSESSYVRVLMTVSDASAVQAIINADNESGNAVKDYADLLAGWNSAVWEYESFTVNEQADTITFEFRYHEAVDALSGNDVRLQAVFDELVVPGYVTNDHLKALYGEDGEFKIAVEAQAVQAVGFENAGAAWDALSQG